MRFICWGNLWLRVVKQSGFDRIFKMFHSRWVSSMSHQRLNSQQGINESPRKEMWLWSNNRDFSMKKLDWISSNKLSNTKNRDIYATQPILATQIVSSILHVRPVAAAPGFDLIPSCRELSPPRLMDSPSDFGHGKWNISYFSHEILWKACGFSLWNSSVFMMNVDGFVKNLMIETIKHGDSWGFNGEHCWYDTDMTDLIMKTRDSTNKSRYLRIWVC